MLLCRFCGRECKNNNSHRNHERLCPVNPNHDTSLFCDKEFQKNRAKHGNSGNQYTKAQRLGLPKPETSNETRKKLRDLILARPEGFAQQVGKKISNTVQKKVSEGVWHTSLAKHMHINYNGVDLHGSWEVAYAKYLDEHQIVWKRNTDLFSYEYNGKVRRYTPDFYLPETDEYVEIKGYKTDKDDAKWTQFPKHRKLQVLMKKDLLNIGINIKR